MPACLHGVLLSTDIEKSPNLAIFNYVLTKGTISDEILNVENVHPTASMPGRYSVKAVCWASRYIEAAREYNKEHHDWTR